MSTMRNALRPFYSVFRPIYAPIVNAVFQKSTAGSGQSSGSSMDFTVANEQVRANLPPFDSYLLRQRPRSRLSKFKPRYPFALDRGEIARGFVSTDPNSPYGHEPELAHLLDLLAPDDAVFLDVGANAGYFSVFLAVRPNFRGHIHAFEPIPDSFASLRSIIDTLKCGDAVTCYEAAVSDRNGTVTMDLGSHAGLASIKDGPVDQGVAVKSLSLDSLNLGRVDFMKVDVEGHEINVLKGANALIKSDSPYIFLESWTFDDPKKVFEPLQFLVDRGYELYLPCWAQSNGTFFVGIGANFEMSTFALVPFTFDDRLTFPGNPINIFACPKSREANLGQLYPATKGAA